MGTDLGVADTRLLARGADRAWADAHLDDVGACMPQKRTENIQLQQKHELVDMDLVSEGSTRHGHGWERRFAQKSANRQKWQAAASSRNQGAATQSPNRWLTREDELLDHLAGDHVPGHDGVLGERLAHLAAMLKTTTRYARL